LTIGPATLIAILMAVRICPRCAGGSDCSNSSDRGNPSTASSSSSSSVSGRSISAGRVSSGCSCSVTASNLHPSHSSEQIAPDPVLHSILYYMANVWSYHSSQQKGSLLMGNCLVAHKLANCRDTVRKYFVRRRGTGPPNSGEHFHFPNDYSKNFLPTWVTPPTPYSSNRRRHVFTFTVIYMCTTSYHDVLTEARVRTPLSPLYTKYFGLKPYISCC